MLIARQITDIIPKKFHVFHQKTTIYKSQSINVSQKKKICIKNKLNILYLDTYRYKIGYISVVYTQPRCIQMQNV